MIHPSSIQVNFICIALFTLHIATYVFNENLLLPIEICNEETVAKENVPEMT